MNEIDNRTSLLNKEDRIKIIKGAITQIETGREGFMCLAIRRAYRNIFDGAYISTYEIQNIYFPELLKYKPKDLEESNSWFPLNPILDVQKELLNAK